MQADQRTKAYCIATVLSDNRLLQVKQNFMILIESCLSFFSIYILLLKISPSSHALCLDKHTQNCFPFVSRFLCLFNMFFGVLEYGYATHGARHTKGERMYVLCVIYIHIDWKLYAKCALSMRFARVELGLSLSIFGHYACKVGWAFSDMFVCFHERSQVVLVDNTF